jgi:MFS family permease
MHTGYYFGFFLAAAANYFIGSRFGWRYMFVVGGLPALLVGLIRNNVQEPAHWAARVQDLGEHWKMHDAFLELFTPRYLRRTVFNSIYLIVSLAGLWAASVYVPAAMTYIATRTGQSAMAAARLASYSTALLGMATVLGALIVPFLAEWLGRRTTLAIFYHHAGFHLGCVRPCVLLGNGRGCVVHAVRIPAGLGRSQLRRLLILAS